MSLIDILKRRTPDSELAPIQASSFADLIGIASSRGVKGFVIVQADSSSPVRNDAGETDYSTHYSFRTKSGRGVEFDESHGLLPDNSGVSLRNLITALSRAEVFSEQTGLPARVISHFVSDPLDPSRDLAIPLPATLEGLQRDADRLRVSKAPFPIAESQVAA